MFNYSMYMRDEMLDRKILTTLEEAKVLINRRRSVYDQIRLYSARYYRPQVR